MARHSDLRASDEDRERVTERLRQAAVEGRLAAHELEQRIGHALRARTYGELNATVSDLPGAGVGRTRGRSRQAYTVVRAHPMLLAVSIPVALVAGAALIAVAVVWATLMLLAALVLGRRGIWRSQIPLRELGYAKFPRRSRRGPRASRI